MTSDETDQALTPAGAEPSAENDTKSVDGPAVEETADDPGGGNDGEAAGKPHREAARYRTRLRETEAERDMLAERLRTLQRAEAERHAQAGSGLTNGADLWAFGGELAELLDGQGNVSADKVAERVKTILDERPYLRRRSFQGSADGGVRGRPVTRSADLANLFQA